MCGNVNMERVYSVSFLQPQHIVVQVFLRIYSDTTVWHLWKLHLWGFNLSASLKKRLWQATCQKLLFIVGRRLNKIINFTLSFCSLFFVSLCFQFLRFFPSQTIILEIRIYRKSTGNRNLQEKEVYELK